METKFTGVDFLKREYEFLFGYLRYTYDVRDKYVRFFIAILGALIAALAYIYTINEASVPSAMVPLLAFSIAGLSIFFLEKAVYSRISTIEYKKKLNKIRGLLLDRSEENKKEEVKLAILPTKSSSIKYYRKWSGDISFLYFLTIIAALGIGMGLFSFLPLLPCVSSKEDWSIIVGISLVAGGKAFGCFWYHWVKRLKNKDKKEKLEEDKSKEETGVS